MALSRGDHVPRRSGDRGTELVHGLREPVLVEAARERTTNSTSSW